MTIWYPLHAPLLRMDLRDMCDYKTDWKILKSVLEAEFERLVDARRKADSQANFCYFDAQMVGINVALDYMKKANLND